MRGGLVSYALSHIAGPMLRTVDGMASRTFLDRNICKGKRGQGGGKGQGAGGWEGEGGQTRESRSACAGGCPQ